MNKRSVLLIEDNQNLNDINRRVLEGEGYTVWTALTLAQAKERLSQISPDVILLDVVLPDGEGFELCQEIRDTTDAHIIFLTSRREHAEMLRGLAVGGDDYITKPFKLDELLLRVAAAMRRRSMQKSPPETLSIGNLTLYVLSDRAAVDGDDLMLTQKEFALLYFLVRHKGESVDAQSIYERVWGQPMGGNNQAVRTAVSRLRKKLEGSGFTISYAKQCEGYCFEEE